MNKSKIQSFVYRVHKNILILNFICLVQKKKVRKKMKECLYWQELNLWLRMERPFGWDATLSISDQEFNIVS